MSYETDEMSRHSWTTNELYLPLITKVVKPHRADERKALFGKKKFVKDNQTRDIVSNSNKGLISSDTRDSSQLEAMNAAGLVLNQEDTLKHLTSDCSKVYNIRKEEQRRRRHKPATNYEGILADDFVSIFCSDGAHKLSREMAFLADVDFIRQEETEKGFKVSEEFTGCLPLAEDEIQDIVSQRKILVTKKNRIESSNAHHRRLTSSTLPSRSQRKFGAEQSVLLQAISILTPSFNSNLNDVWPKRMNTLRFFILAVTRWIVQRRAGIRLQAIKERLLLATGGIQSISNLSSALRTKNVNSLSTSSTDEVPSTDALQLAIRKELVRKWVEEDNSSNVIKGLQNRNAILEESLDRTDVLDCHSKNSPSAPKSMLTVNDRSAAVRNNLFGSALGHCEIFQSEQILNRTLFPCYVVEECDTLQALKVEAAVEFDDRTFFHLKVRSTHIGTRYAPHKISDLPLFFTAKRKNIIPKGAIEEEM